MRSDEFATRLDCKSWSCVSRFVSAVRAFDELALSVAGFSGRLGVWKYRYISSSLCIERNFVY